MKPVRTPQDVCYPLSLSIPILYHKRVISVHKSAIYTTLPSRVHVELGALRGAKRDIGVSVQIISIVGPYYPTKTRDGQSSCPESAASR